ncbi:MAG: sugar phosphate nucleotidyltransferase [Anaerolineales bacterium]
MADIKIIIPMAGIGKRFFPLTNHRPKPLVRLAEKRLLDHVLDVFRVLEKDHTLEYIFIIGYLGEQIQEHMGNTHPEKNVAFYEQKEFMGQSHAVYLAKAAVAGPVLLTYCDTITKTDFSFLASDPGDGAVLVHEVEDPRRHGVAILDQGSRIKRLVEKPETMEHTLALTGLCYFPAGELLINAIETQMDRGISLNNEYYLADAINILLEGGSPIRAEKALKWLDAGTPEAILDTNAYLLRHPSEARPDNKISHSTILIEPVYVHPSSQIRNSIIGPNVSIGANCVIEHSILKDTIVDDNSNLTTASFTNSLIGRGCSVKGRGMQQVIADHDEFELVTRKME